MSIIQLTSSRFLGGPERQILGLADALTPRFETHVVSFSEGGLCQSFLEEATRRGISATQLQHDTPHLWRAVCELVNLIRAHSAEAVFCGGYKANLIGLIAALRG